MLFARPRPSSSPNPSSQGKAGFFSFFFFPLLKLRLNRSLNTLNYKHTHAEAWKFSAWNERDSFPIYREEAYNISRVLHLQNQLVYTIEINDLPISYFSAGVSKIPRSFVFRPTSKITCGFRFTLPAAQNSTSLYAIPSRLKKKKKTSYYKT